jgi:hypothetical protein
MASTVNLSIDQGTSFARVLTIQDDSNVAIDITGYTFRGQARVKYDSASPSLTFAFAIRTQTGGNVGKVDMSLAAAATESLAIKAATSYVYDVEMVEPGGTVRRLFEGIVTVSPEATK